jgi:hypothetical protein
MKTAIYLETGELVGYLKDIVSTNHRYLRLVKCQPLLKPWFTATAMDTITHNHSMNYEQIELEVVQSDYNPPYCLFRGKKSKLRNLRGITLFK